MWSSGSNRASISRARSSGASRPRRFAAPGGALKPAGVSTCRRSASLGEGGAGRLGSWVTQVHDFAAVRNQLGFEADVEASFEVRHHSVGGVDDALGGLEDQLSVAAGPSRDVGDAVAGGVEFDRLGDEVGDGFGLDLPCVLWCVGAVFVVEVDVGPLVEEGLDPLGWLELDADVDGSVEVAGATVPLVER